jgi:hypothetical protein
LKREEKMRRGEGEAERKRERDLALNIEGGVDIVEGEVEGRVVQANERKLDIVIRGVENRLQTTIRTNASRGRRRSAEQCNIQHRQRQGDGKSKRRTERESTYDGHMSVGVDGDGREVDDGLRLHDQDVANVRLQEQRDGLGRIAVEQRELLLPVAVAEKIARESETKKKE